MDIAGVIRAIGDGGIAIIELVIIWFLWRELTRSRKECEGQLTELRRRQVSNVSRLAKLEGKLEVFERATINYSFENVGQSQPLTPLEPDAEEN